MSEIERTLPSYLRLPFRGVALVLLWHSSIFPVFFQSVFPLARTCCEPSGTTWDVFRHLAVDGIFVWYFSVLPLSWPTKLRSFGEHPEALVEHYGQNSITGTNHLLFMFGRSAGCTFVG